MLLLFLVSAILLIVIGVLIYIIVQERNTVRKYMIDKPEIIVSPEYLVVTEAECKQEMKQPIIVVPVGGSSASAITSGSSIVTKIVQTPQSSIVTKLQADDVLKRANLMAIAYYNAFRDKIPGENLQWEKIEKHLYIVGFGRDTLYTQRELQLSIFQDVVNTLPYIGKHKVSDVVNAIVYQLQNFKGTVNNPGALSLFDLEKKLNGGSTMPSLRNTFGALQPDVNFFPYSPENISGLPKGSIYLFDITTDDVLARTLLDEAMLSVSELSGTSLGVVTSEVSQENAAVVISEEATQLTPKVILDSKSQPNNEYKRANLMTIAYYNAIRDNTGTDMKLTIYKHLYIVGLYNRIFKEDNLIQTIDDTLSNLPAAGKFKCSDAMESILNILRNYKPSFDNVEGLDIFEYEYKLAGPSGFPEIETTFGMLPFDSLFYPSYFANYFGAENVGSDVLYDIQTESPTARQILDDTMIALGQK